LAYVVRNTLDSLRWRFKQEDWFLEAWEKYRQHVLEAGLGGSIKMPGYVFKPYLERYFDEHPNKFGLLNSDCSECSYSDLDIGEYLEHHGIKGQKWGVRRWQEESGALTPEGRERYRDVTATKEVLERTPKYSKVSERTYREYIKNRKTSGMKKGALAGAGLGALAGITKYAYDISDMNRKGYVPANGGTAVNSFIRRTLWGAANGALGGALIGRWIGGKKAKADYADIGKKYTEKLLNEPIDRITHSDISEDFIEHHGIKGQKWGLRRYQYEDGSLTAEGRARYNNSKDSYKYDPKNPDAIKDWEKKNLYKENGKYYYTNKKGEKTLYKTNINELDDKEIKDLKSRVEAENSIAKMEADIQKREYDKGLKDATQGSKDSQAVLDSSARVLDATVRALPTGNGHYERKDYSNLSDQELRNRISRIQLEESYGRLSGDTKYIKSGSEKAREILQTAGAIVAIGASAAGLAYTISEIKYRRANANKK